jgi:hypothetical protein
VIRRHVLISLARFNFVVAEVAKFASYRRFNISRNPVGLSRSSHEFLIPLHMHFQVALFRALLNLLFVVSGTALAAGNRGNSPAAAPYRSVMCKPIFRNARVPAARHVLIVVFACRRSAALVFVSCFHRTKVRCYRMSPLRGG